MNRLMRIANPVVVFVLICAFVYIYFFYLRGADPRSLSRRQQKRKRPGTMCLRKTPIRLLWPDPLSSNRTRLTRLTSRIWFSRRIRSRRRRGIRMLSPRLSRIYRRDPKISASRSSQIRMLPGSQSPYRTRALQEGHWIGLEVIPLTRGHRQGQYHTAGRDRGLDR